MTATTYPEYNSQTEGLEVTKAFAEHVRGRTIVVTGANRGGIGFATLEAIASQSPAHLILAGRTPVKIQECIDALKVQYPNVDYRPLKLDLSSQKSVRDAAAEILSWPDVASIDVMINSAGVMLLPQRTLNEDGIEMHFGTNHIGHFLFTCLVMPKLIRAAQSAPRGATRIVNVSSLSPVKSKMRWSDTNFDKLTKDLPEIERPSVEMLSQWGITDIDNKSYIPLEGYNQSKVANVLFGIAANKRLYEKYGILSLAVHPGIIKTELSRDAAPEIRAAVKSMEEQGVIKYQTLGAGAATSLVAALDPKLSIGEDRNGIENWGAYMIECQISDRAHPLAVSSSEAEKLWSRSEELVQEKFAW